MINRHFLRKPSFWGILAPARVALLLFALSFSLQVRSQAAEDYQSEDSTQLSPEEQVMIGRVFLMGNKRTQERIIRRELSFTEGETWGKELLIEALELDKRKLANLRLFNTVELDLAPVNKNTVDVVVRVTERWYVWPSVIFQLSDRSFNEWWFNQNHDFSRIEYGGGLDWYNVRGANERLSIKAQLGFNKKLRFSYKFPYIDEAQITGLSLESSYTTSNWINHRSIDNRQDFMSSEDIIYSDLYMAATLSRRPDYYNTHYLKVSYNNRTIGDTVALANPDFFLDGATQQQFFRISYQLTHDQRDVFAYPLDGKFWEVGIHQQGLGLVSNFHRTQLYSTYAQYWPLKEKLFVASRTSGHLSFPEKQPYNLFQTLGYGRDFVRGYELQVIEGQHFFLNKTNLKYRLLRQRIDLGRLMPLSQFRQIPIDIYLKTYFDQGYVWNSLPYEDNQRLINRYLFGTGLGLDIVTFYDAVLRIEYSRNREGDWAFYYGFRADL